MKKIILLLSIIIIAISWCFGQNNNVAYFKNGLNNFDLNASGNGTSSVFAFGANHLHTVTKNKKFRIGYGIRFNSSNGSGNFITAPAKLTSGVESPLVIFSDDKLENFDTIGISSFNVNSLNASIHLNYAFTKKWEVEFNIDAIGFSFGNAVNAQYQSSKRTVEGIDQKAKPSAFNLLLISDNDLGNLNSEIKIKYYFRNNWAINFGGTFIFTEFTTNNKLFKDNDRFRQKAFVPMIGISYSPFKNTHQ
jgi:hypothetical protein